MNENSKCCISLNDVWCDDRMTGDGYEGHFGSKTEGWSLIISGSPECPLILSPRETLAWHAINGDGVMRLWHIHTVDIAFKASLCMQPYIRYLLYLTENAKKSSVLKFFKRNTVGRVRTPTTGRRAPCRFAPHAERKREQWRIATIRSYLLQDGPAGFYTGILLTVILKKRSLKIALRHPCN